METAKDRTPFSIPELRHRISLFVTVKDALSCALVSKTWARDYLPVIWSQVDFDSEPQFADLTPATIAKHGRLIQIVRNAKTLPQIKALANGGVNRLKDLHIETTASTIQHLLAYEVVSRNSSSLLNLRLSAATAIPPNKQDSLAHYVSAPALVPSYSLTTSLPQGPSKLKYLSIDRLCLTHDSLVAILQGCPKLYELKLVNTDIVGSPTVSFQHTGVKVFWSSLKSILLPRSSGPPLLSLFPSLTSLCILDFDPAFTVSSRSINELPRFCPLLTGYKLEDHNGTIIPKFLMNRFTSDGNNNNISEITFKYEHTTVEAITAILLHQASLKTVATYYRGYHVDIERGEVIPVSDHFQASGYHLQLIPRSCPKLQAIDLHYHEMDMDVVEQGEWVCKNLLILRVRIKDLDTKDKILKAVAFWRAGCRRRWQKKMTGVAMMAEEQALQGRELDQSIEARVARHLLKFDKLWWVWLGYQTWTPI